MFDQLIDPMPDTKHQAAAEFFMSMKKQAGVKEPLRVEARQAIKKSVETNPLPARAPTAPASRPPEAKATAIKVPSVEMTKHPTAPKLSMKKQAFIGEALRAVAHAAQGSGARIAKSLGSGLRRVGKYREGFKAGYTAKAPGWLGQQISRFGGPKGNWQVKSPGSEFFMKGLTRRKGKAYASAYAAGMDVRKGVAPDTLRSGARHFVSPTGDITAGSIAKGLHTIGLINPETTAGAARQALQSVASRARAGKSLSSRTGLSNTQLALGGGTAAGLGYLALRPKKEG